MTRHFILLITAAALMTACASKPEIVALVRSWLGQKPEWPYKCFKRRGRLRPASAVNTHASAIRWGVLFGLYNVSARPKNGRVT